jgi:hypothetical protein
VPRPDSYSWGRDATSFRWPWLPLLVVGALVLIVLGSHALFIYWLLMVALGVGSQGWFLYRRRRS